MTSSNRTSSQDRWLRFFNTIGYNALAPVYNGVEIISFGAWTRWIRRSLDYVPAESTVLEIGFGPGKLHVDLARRSEHVFGLDLAMGMCRFTRNRLQQNDLVAKISRGNVFSLPYADNTFDVVVSTFAFSGFPRGDNAMREIVRVIKKGGTLALVDIGLPEDHNATGVFFARLWEKMGDFLYDQPQLMRQSGLELIQYDEFGTGRHIRLIVGQKPPVDSESRIIQNF